MAVLSPVFQAESERVHHDHENMLSELAELDAALDCLVCYSEVFADLRGAGAVQSVGRRLAQELPEHCKREEAKVLDTVSEVSPEFAEFVTEMKRQHNELYVRLNAFCLALDELAGSPDLDAAIAHLKEEGQELTRCLRQHISVEEPELSGPL